MIKENIKILIQFKETINSETDRGCALMTISFLESQLERVLIKKLIGDKNFKKELFSNSGPLSSFSSKIKLSYSLGIINKDVMKNLNLIRKIRNEFGDDYSPISFESSKISKLVFNLTESFYLKGEVKPRRFFENSALTIILSIQSEFETEKFKEKTYIPTSELDRKKMKNEAEMTANEIIEAMIAKIQNE